MARRRLASAAPWRLCTLPGTDEESSRFANLGSPSGGRLVLVAGGVVAAVATVLSLQLGLDGEVQFTFGTITAHQAGGGTFINSFAGRPLAYRLIAAIVGDILSPLISNPGGHAAFEAAVRLLGILACVAAAVLLWRALGTRIGRAERTAVSVAPAFALAFAPNWDFLQPEWLATLFVMLAVAGALLPRREVVAGLVSGACIVAIVAVKLSTLPLALLAVLLIWILDGRRVRAALAGAVLLGLGWLAIVVLAIPLERTWMVDLSLLNPNSPIRAGFDVKDVIAALGAIGNQAALCPIVILAPASVVILARSVSSPRARLLIVGACCASLVLAIGPLIAQGEWILYQLTALPPLCAALVGLAAVRWWRATGRASALLLVPLPVLAIVMTVVLAEPSIPARNPVAVMVATAVIAAALALLAAVLPPHLTGWRPITVRSSVLLAGVVLIALGPVLTPSAAWSLDGISTPWHNGQWAATSAQSDANLLALSRQIGPGTPVLYLTWGDVPYHMGNPTDCGYPSPTWLQRGIYRRNALLLRLASYKANRACLDSPVPRYLVIDPTWFRLDLVQPAIRAEIETRYDCSAAIAAGSVLACPRRV